MRRHILIAVALAVLVSTAGCAGILGPDESTPTTDGEPTTTTENPNGSSADLEEYPSGFSADGVTDAEAAVGSHQAATLDTSSWTATYTTSFSSENKSQTIEETRLVDHENSVELQTVSSPFGNQTTYKLADEGWRQRKAMNQTGYSYAANGYNSTKAVHGPMLTSFLSNVNYTQASTSEQDGTTYITYEATGLTEDSKFASDENSTTELNNIDSTFTVTDEGRITEFNFAATVVSQDKANSDVEIALLFSDVGSTSVEEPAWLDEAKNQTSDSAPNSSDGS